MGRPNYRDAKDEVRCMMGADETRMVFDNLLDLAASNAEVYAKKAGIKLRSRNKHAIMVTNFQIADLSSASEETESIANHAAANRVSMLIHVTRPTKVLIVGLYAESYLMERSGIEYPAKKRGNPHQVEFKVEFKPNEKELKRMQSLEKMRSKALVRELESNEYHPWVNFFLEEVAHEGAKLADFAKKGGTYSLSNTVQTFSTIDYDRAFTSGSGESDLDDDAVVEANLLGYVSRNIANCLLGCNPFSLRHLFSEKQPSGPKGKPTIQCHYVDTLKKFDTLWDKVMEADLVSLDVETTGFYPHTNRLLSLQVATRKEEGFFVPLYHKDTPFTKKELEHIRLRVKALLELKVTYHKNQRRKRMMLGQNFGFDKKWLMHWCDVRYLYWPVWDTIAGEFCLDDNLKGLVGKALGYKYTPFSLDSIVASYENYHYLESEFGKEDRTTIEHAKFGPGEPVVTYGCMDVVFPIAAMEQQLNRAECEHWPTGNYRDTLFNFMLAQMSNMIKVQSGMSHRGIMMDQGYMEFQLSEEGVFAKDVERLTRELYASKNVKKASEMLRGKKGIPQGSLFGNAGGGGDAAGFNHAKQEHLEILFFDVLKLAPVNVKKETDKRSLDDDFKKAYKAVPEVACWAQMGKMQRLLDTFIRAIYNHMNNDPDYSVHNRLHPGYGFKEVVTGRSNSSKPSLQQIPVHSAEAKYVKRQFVAPMWTLFDDADYSSHEVRCAGITAFDEASCSGFRKIHNIVLDHRLYPSKDNKIVLLTAGDSHKQNYSRFTGLDIKEWITFDLTEEGKKKAKALRQIAKTIVFGAIYGKSAPSLAAELGISVEEAEELLFNFFKEFADLKDWLEWTKDYSNKHLYTFGPHGRKRRLFGYITGIKRTQSAMERRAQNSPIQGFASDVMFDAAEMYAQKQHEVYALIEANRSLRKMLSKELEIVNQFPTGANVLVHDSSKSESPFNFLLMNMHIKEWCMTTGVQNYLESNFDMQFLTPFGIDFDIGASWADMEGWDFNPTTLIGPQPTDKDGKPGMGIIETALENSQKIHNYSFNTDKVAQGMFTSYHMLRDELKLDELFPLNMKYCVDKDWQVPTPKLPK
ncbi:DNA polymerase [Pseudomonas phage vB_PpuM-Voja-6]